MPTNRPIPTVHELELMRLIQRLCREQGEIPGVRQLAREKGVTPKAVRKQLQSLERKGLLVDKPVTVRLGRYQPTAAGLGWLIR